MVRTLDTLKAELERTGHQVVMVTPDLFRSVACPTYPEIRLALAPSAKLARLIEAAQPCAIHIATEGPLGWAARRFCRRRQLPFTSAYHTKFPEYVRARFGVPLGLSYRVMRRFHDASARVMVATRSIENELTARGFSRLGRWSRGVDTAQFRPRPECRGEHGPLAGLARPIFLSVGRVAVEKNIEAFLALDLPGSKVVVGDGPMADELKRRHPEAHFVGARFGEDLARHYAAADVFVFPSMTDTFGLVLLEALASGLPVAAYPVPGPLDVLEGGTAGILDTDLGKAARAALALSPEACRAHAMGFSWAAATQQFLANLQPFDPACSPDPAPHLASMA
ncbi:Glycosyltransferase [Magnetospirillum sp. LM-5]|nr:Glycosyltransferase [Magnetospirillum sp. LM-5]